MDQDSLKLWKIVGFRIYLGIELTAVVDRLGERFEGKHNQRWFLDF